MQFFFISKNNKNQRSPQLTNSNFFLSHLEPSIPPLQRLLFPLQCDKLRLILIEKTNKTWKKTDVWRFICIPLYSCRRFHFVRLAVRKRGHKLRKNIFDIDRVMSKIRNYFFKFEISMAPKLQKKNCRTFCHSCRNMHKSISQISAIICDKNSSQKPEKNKKES